MQKILEKAVLMRLAFNKAGNARKMNKADVKTECDETRYKAQKVLFTSDEYAAIATHDGETLSQVMTRAIPCNVGLRGVCLLPLAMVEEVDKYLIDRKAKRAELVAAFLAVYDLEADRAVAEMRGTYNPADYPDKADIERRFDMRWSYLQLSSADGLPPEIKEREEAKLRERFDSVEKEIQQALREAFATLTSKLAERLRIGEDGKKKIFRDTAIENLVDFLETFNRRNITDDAELAELANQAQKIILGSTPDTLRKSRTVREVVRMGLDAVTRQALTLITTNPTRKIDLED